MAVHNFKKGFVCLLFISMLFILVSCSSDPAKDDTVVGGKSSNSATPSSDSHPSSSSTVAVSSNSEAGISSSSAVATSSNSETETSSSSEVAGSVASSSSSATGSQACTEYEPAFCGGLAYGEVPSNSTTMPGTGKCLFIGDFEQIQPNQNSTVAINGMEVTLGSAWADSTIIKGDKKPAKKDDGYYVYVKAGTINSYQNNGWKTIVAKAKPDCGGTVQSSSSVAAASSSSRATASSSSRVTASSSSRAVSSSSVAVASSSSRAGNTTCSATRGKVSDIKYIPDGTSGQHTKHKLDLTLPSSGNGPFPLVIFLHGGGFTGGSKADDPGASGEGPKTKGYALASVGYRLSGDTGGKFPGSFNDILTAIRFLRANADTYCLDPDKFVITGFSAGAWHAGMVCVLSGYDDHGLDGFPTLYPGVSNKVQACATYSALTDMAYLAEDEAKNPNVNYMMANHGASSPEAGFLNINAALNTLPETGPPNASIRWKANPLNYVTTKTPPIYMIAAENDNVVPWQQSERLVNKINSVVSGRAVFDKQQTGGHSGFSNRSTQVFDFLNQNLK